jgi:hypothetical protein
MSNAGQTVVTPRPAATVVILRDGREGLEVFMVVRHHEIDFASGALVFPGGKVDAEDADPAGTCWHPMPRPLPIARSWWRPARDLREAGLVLARRRRTQAMLDAADAHRLVETYRAGLLAGSTTFLDLVRSEDLLLATDLMVPFATGSPASPQALRRIFSGRGAVEQLGMHDGTGWSGAMDRRAGRARRRPARTLVFATQMNLKLARYGTVADAVAATRTSALVTVTPRVERTATGRTLHIPAEAGYGVTEFAVPMPKP